MPSKGGYVVHHNVLCYCGYSALALAATLGRQSLTSALIRMERRRKLNKLFLTGASQGARPSLLVR